MAKAFTWSGQGRKKKKALGSVLKQIIWGGAGLDIHII